ncbi:hypothetical protein [Polaribacter sp. Asnod1-A03]|uniref:hypothetical protein n=1 Tax=Polaribacter sp. Asnod1-A03 TaxID=3160581 RepID=UPI00386B1D2E
MKNILFIAVLLLSIHFYAQPPGGGGGRPSQNEQRSESDEIKEFKASDVAGVFYYDESEIIKKLKVKDEEKQNLVKKSLRNYNAKVREISFLNSEKFSDLDVVVNATMSAGNREAGTKIREKVEEVVKPVKEEILIYEEELNKEVENILSEKQFKKWMKYQNNKKESLEPRDSQNNEEGGRPSRGVRQ